MRPLLLALALIGITPCMAQRASLDSLLPRLLRFLPAYTFLSLPDPTVETEPIVPAPE
jgi:hypothetical protein